MRDVDCRLGTGKWHVQVLKVEELGFSGVRRQRGAGIGRSDEAGDGASVSDLCFGTICLAREEGTATKAGAVQRVR